jgi:hypothetical protein
MAAAQIAICLPKFLWFCGAVAGAGLRPLELAAESPSFTVPAEDFFLAAGGASHPPAAGGTCVFIVRRWGEIMRKGREAQAEIFVPVASGQIRINRVGRFIRPLA